MMILNYAIDDFPVVEWITKTLADNPDKVFLISENGQISYSELLKEIQEKNELIRSKNLAPDRYGNRSRYSGGSCCTLNS